MSLGKICDAVVSALKGDQSETLRTALVNIFEHSGYSELKNAQVHVNRSENLLYANNAYTVTFTLNTNLLDEIRKNSPDRTTYLNRILAAKQQINALAIFALQRAFPIETSDTNCCKYRSHLFAEAKKYNTCDEPRIEILEGAIPYFYTISRQLTESHTSQQTTLVVAAETSVGVPTPSVAIHLQPQQKQEAGLATNKCHAQVDPQPFRMLHTNILTLFSANKEIRLENITLELNGIRNQYNLIITKQDNAINFSLETTNGNPIHFFIIDNSSNAFYQKDGKIQPIANNINGVKLLQYICKQTLLQLKEERNVAATAMPQNVTETADKSLNLMTETEELRKFLEKIETLSHMEKTFTESYERGNAILIASNEGGSSIIYFNGISSSVLDKARELLKNTQFIFKPLAGITDLKEPPSKTPPTLAATSVSTKPVTASVVDTTYSRLFNQGPTPALGGGFILPPVVVPSPNFHR